MKKQKSFNFNTKLFISIVLLFTVVMTSSFIFTMVVINNIVNFVKVSYRKATVDIEQIADLNFKNSYHNTLKYISKQERTKAEYVFDVLDFTVEYLSKIINDNYNRRDLNSNNVDIVKQPDKNNDGEFVPQLLTAKGANKNSNEYKKDLIYISNISGNLNHILYHSVKIDRAYVMTDSGVIVIADNMSSDKFDENGDIRELEVFNKEWYIDSKKEDGVTLRYDREVYTHKNILTFITNIKKDGKAYGIVALEVFIENLPKSMFVVGDDDEYIDFIIDESSKIIYCSDDKLLEQLKNDTNTFERFLKTISNDYVDDETEFEILNKKYIVMYDKMQLNDWIFATAIDKETIDKKVEDIKSVLAKENQEARDQVKENVMFVIIYTIIFFILSIIIVSIIIKLFANKISKPVDEMANENKMMNAELDIAKKIQQNMLPRFDIDKAYPNRNFDIYGLNLPEKEVGGDFYDYIFIDPEHIILVIADVSGAGVPAALFMAKAKTLIHSIIKFETRPDEILKIVNNELCDQNDESYFVTAGIYFIDLKTKQITSSNAGHEDPIVIKNNGKVVLEKEIHSPALATTKDIDYKVNILNLEDGDILFLYTDGVVEAINSKDELYGIDRLLSELRSNSNTSASEIIEHIKNSIIEFSDVVEQYDDITMLCIKFKKENIVEQNDTKVLNHTIFKKINQNTLEEVMSEAIIFIKNAIGDDIYKTISLSIEISLEEMLVNVIDYAYTKTEIDNNLADLVLEITIDKNENKIYIKSVDAGVKFNPLLVKEPNIDAAIEDRKIGGMGIYLFKHYMDEVKYGYIDNKNVLTMIKKYI